MVRSNDLSDVIAADVMAFDIHVFDPLAPSYRPSPSSQYEVTPVDPGYRAIAAANLANFEGLGGYVDLGFNCRPDGGPVVPGLLSHFSGPPHPKSGVFVPRSAPPFAARVYDTWSSLYERDGINQDGVATADQGTDGLDSNNSYVVDGLEELETSPPYPFPLRGVEILLRMRELSSQQVRQASVVADLINH